MIVETCPTCGGDVVKPDPPGRTKEEKIAFREEWDRRYEEGQKRDASAAGS